MKDVVRGGITVVTPTFNRAALLEKALASVGTQSILPCEHIICDNLSGDATPNTVRNYAAQMPFPVRYLREQDQGIYQAMNRAIKIASGDAIFVLNDDDQLHNRDVLRVFATCLSRSQADLIYGDTVWLDLASGATQYRRHNQVNKMTLVHKAISQQAIIYKTSAFEKCGLFDESFRIVGDYDWLLRAFLKHQVAALYLNRPVAFCGLGGMSNSDSTVVRRSAERKEVTNRYYSAREVELAGLYRRVIRKLPLGTMLFDLACPLRLDVRKIGWFDKWRTVLA